MKGKADDDQRGKSPRSRTWKEMSLSACLQGLSPFWFLVGRFPFLGACQRGGPISLASSTHALESAARMPLARSRASPNSSFFEFDETTHVVGVPPPHSPPTPTPRASCTGGKGHGWRRGQGRGAGRGGVDSLVHTQPTHDDDDEFCVCERWPPTPPTHPLSTRLQTPTTAPLPTVHDEARWGLPLRGPGVVPRGWGWRNNPFVSWVL